MRTSGPTVLAALAAAHVACPVDEDIAPRPELAHRYVDARAGDDAAGDGSPAKPFRTITRALAAARGGATVHVGAGTYDAASGESFPLRIPDGVSLVRIASAADSPRLEGSGMHASPAAGGSLPVAVVTGAGSQIQGLRISAPGGAAVWSEGSSTPAAVRGTTLTQSDYGLVVVGKAAPLLDSNTVFGNARVGIEVGGEAAPIIRRNTVSGNSIGVAVRDAAEPDLGTPGSPGGNALGANVECDVVNEAASVIRAMGNSWDHDPFLIAASPVCAGGADVANTAQGTGAVLFQDPPTSTAPIFPVPTRIATEAPAQGAVIGTTAPAFTWEPTGSGLAMAGAFTEPIAVAGGRITNADRMVWAWHTGLGRGREGAVTFADGVAPVRGSLDGAGPAVPLVRGRTFYWAVWAWGDDGLSVVQASALQYFTVVN